MIPKVTENIFVNGLNEDTVAWKQAFIWDEEIHRIRKVIIKLTIPKDAKLVLGHHKCRASYVKVEGIYPVFYTVDKPDPTTALKRNFAGAWWTYPTYTFAYAVGLAIYPDRFDPDPSVTCSHGIHFFRTYREAVAYSFI